MITGFHTPILVLDDYPDCEGIADRFAALAQQTKKNDPNGGLVSEAWKYAKTAETPEDYEKHGYTSFYNQNLANEEGYEEIHKAAVGAIEEYLNRLGKNKGFRIDNSWAAIYGKGHYVPAHCHSYSHISLVFYAAATDGTGQIVFRDPAYESNKMYYVGDQKLTNDRLEIQPQKGMFIVFPSFVEHYSNPHKGDEERIIFSCNSNFVGKNNNKGELIMAM
jgi:uncharacterized protein (TIGR02466 family)